MTKSFKLLYDGLVHKIETKHNKKLTLQERKNLLEFLIKNSNGKINQDPKLKIISNSQEIIKRNEQLIQNGISPDNLEAYNIGFVFRSLDDNNLKRLIIQKIGEKGYEEFLNLKDNHNFDGLTNFFISNNISDHSYFDSLFEGSLCQFPGLYDFIKKYYKYELKPISFQVVPKQILIGFYKILLKGVVNRNLIIKEFGLDKYSETTRNEILSQFDYVYGLNRGANLKKYAINLRSLMDNKYNTIFLYFIK